MPEQKRPPVIIANSIRLKRSADPDRSFLVVEGQDDKAFFGRHARSCDIVVAWGRPNVVGVIVELDRTSFLGALGVVDADFTILEGEGLVSPNLVVTDHHDVESMMLDSPALSHLLRELGDDVRLAEFGRERATTLTEYLLSAGKWIGYLRWASARNKWSLDFEELDFSRFVRERDLGFDLHLFLVEIRNHQGGRTTPLPSEGEMQSAITALASPLHDLWHVCCGHDLVNLLSIGFRRVLGKNNEALVRRDRLEQQLRLAYEERYFKETRIYQAIFAWEVRNRPFKILDQEQPGS